MACKSKSDGITDKLLDIIPSEDDLIKAGYILEITYSNIPEHLMMDTFEDLKKKVAAGEFRDAFLLPIVYTPKAAEKIVCKDMSPYALYVLPGKGAQKPIALRNKELSIGKPIIDLAYNKRTKKLGGLDVLGFRIEDNIIKSLEERGFKQAGIYGNIPPKLLNETLRESCDNNPDAVEHVLVSLHNAPELLEKVVERDFASYALFVR